MAYSVGGEKKTVQEIASDGGDPPPSFVRREEERPKYASLPSSPIPPVDLHLLLSSDADSKEHEMEKLRSALHTWGLFQAIGHGISDSLIDEVRKIAKEYFDLPPEEKQKYSKAVYKEGDGNDETALQDQVIDWVDHLYLLVSPEEARDLSCWPENPSSFRTIMDEYAKKIKVVIEMTLKALAKLIDLDEDYFLNQFGGKAGTYARFNFYPHCLRPDLVLGIKPHSDGSGITVLLPDPEVEGLEVLKDSQWVKVDAIPHALIINVGDQIEIMSNGILKSPVHRAVVNSAKERISLAMFHTAEAEREIGPANELIDDDNGRPKLYKTFKVQDYLEMYYKKFTEGKRPIHWAKV